MRLANAPFFALGSFLCLCLGMTLLFQCIGQYLDISLVKASLPAAAIASLLITYGYFFNQNPRHITYFIAGCLLLGIMGLFAISVHDMTSDGMGYQQPSAEAILQGWNPLHHNARMLWQNIYPSGASEIEAALASLYGTIEAAKSLQFYWLLIASCLLFSGMQHYRRAPLTPGEIIILSLILLCPIVITQALTHYVDAFIYLAGVSFIGSMLHLGDDARRNRLAWLLMASCIFFIVNTKLSGLYHAATLCACAITFIWLERRQFPLRPAVFLFATGLVATFILGFHPYVTNIETYGSLLHMNADAFSGFQRPSNLSGLHSFQKFFYSLFSTTGGAPRQPAELKWPLTAHYPEWTEAGAPDSRTGGFGLYTAPGFLMVCVLMALDVKQAKQWDKKLLAVSALLLLAAMIFPEGWWARYVPFAYIAFLLPLLALSARMSLLRYAAIALFFANSLVAASATYIYVKDTQDGFRAITDELHERAGGPVYLIPPGEDYEIYNHAYMPLQRWLGSVGVTATIRVEPPCSHNVARLSEFTICY